LITGWRPAFDSGKKKPDPLQTKGRFGPVPESNPGYTETGYSETGYTETGHTASGHTASGYTG
jgi:hypothetical protein